MAGHYVDLAAASRVPALLLLAEDVDDHGLAIASKELQRVTHENPKALRLLLRSFKRFRAIRKVLQAGEFFLRAALEILRAPRPCRAEQRGEAMASALRRGAHLTLLGLVDDVAAEAQSLRAVRAVTSELGALAALHSDDEVLGRLTASGESKGEEVQSEKSSFVVPAILWFASCL